MLSTAEVAVLVLASILVLGGLGAVLWRDLGARQAGVGGVRRAFEALVPVAGAVVLLAAVWAWAV